jgi:hypothetical protein
VDLSPEFEIEAPDTVTRHSLLAVVYGNSDTGEPTAFVTRVKNPDGRLVEHDAALSNGRFRPVLDAKGEAALWETLTRKERWEVRGRRALVAVYVMKRALLDM